MEVPTEASVKCSKVSISLLIKAGTDSPGALTSPDSPDTLTFNFRLNLFRFLNIVKWIGIRAGVF